MSNENQMQRQTGSIRAAIGCTFADFELSAGVHSDRNIIKESNGNEVLTFDQLRGLFDL